MIGAVAAFPHKITSSALLPLAACIDGLKALKANSRGAGEQTALLEELSGDMFVEEDWPEEKDFYTSKGDREIGVFRKPARSLHQSQSQCGATLTLISAGMASIVSASPSQSICSSAAVLPEAQLMDLIIGAVVSVNQASHDMQVVNQCGVLPPVCLPEHF